MKIFKVLLEGKNCQVNVEGTTQRLGFFTARTVYGLDSTQAEEAIRRKLEDELRSKILNNKDDPPKIIFDEFIEIDSETANHIPKAGCTWYPEDPSHQS
jgi:hypothetical protein